MMETPPGPFLDSSTEDLDNACLDLWGEDWAGQLSKFTGVSLRTCQRIRAAAKADTNHPKSSVVLGELLRRLAEVGAHAHPQAGYHAIVSPTLQQRERRQLAGVFITTNMPIAPAFTEKQRAVGPFLQDDFETVFDEMVEIEQDLVEVVDDLMFALSSPSQEVSIRGCYKALARGVQTLDGVVMIGGDGRPCWLLEGQTAFTDEIDEIPAPWDALILPAIGNEGLIRNMADYLNQQPHFNVEPIRILAEPDSEEVAKWVLAVSGPEQPLNGLSQMVNKLRRDYGIDAIVRLFRAMDVQSRGDILLFPRDEEV